MMLCHQTNLRFESSSVIMDELLDFSEFVSLNIEWSITYLKDYCEN